MSQLQLSLLGTPVVKHGERTLTFSTRKALALLVYLAVEDAEHGRAALRATLLELRKLLERCHEPGEQSHLHIERDTLGIEHASQPILDIRFIEYVSKLAGRQVEPFKDQAGGELMTQLEQATRLARGPFLASFTLRDSQFFDDWTRQQREYCYLRVHHLFNALSMLYERAGDGERAIETVTRWLNFDPLNEEGYRRLMRLRFSRGDRAGALRAYANGRAVLADELQVEPEPETVALAKRIRHTAPVRCTSGAVSAASRLTRTISREPAGRSVPGTNRRVRHLDRVLPARACGTASAHPTSGGNRDRQNAPGHRICPLGTGSGGRCADGESSANRKTAPVPATHRCPSSPTGAGTCPR